MFDGVNRRTDALTDERQLESLPITCNSPCEPSAKFTFFFCMCNNITILAFNYKNQCGICRAVMATRFACRSYKPCPILPLARALHSLSLSCLYRLHET